MSLNIQPCRPSTPNHIKTIDDRLKTIDGHIKTIQASFNTAIEKASAQIREKQMQELKALRAENEEAITKKILNILLD